MSMFIGALVALVAFAALPGCARSSRPEPAPLLADSPHDATAPLPRPSADAPLVTNAVADAGAVADAAPRAPATAPRPDDAKVKVVTIGMHVAGGPFDEPTKEPFKRAVEPHFPDLTECWNRHLTTPPKQVDVGVDLLIEAAGGHPKVSNPRSTLEKSEAEELLRCVIASFESVEFPKLERGRTGVSYSLRFTRK